MNSQRKGRIEEREPTCTLIGDLPLITPRPIWLLHPATQERVERIEALLSAGDRAAASRLAVAIEDDLGVTAEERVIAMRPTEPWQGHLEIALGASVSQGLTKITAAPAPHIELPDAERGRDPVAVKRWEKAIRKLARERDKLTDAQIEDRLRGIASIEAEPADRAEREWAEAARRDTIDRERARLPEDDPDAPELADNGVVRIVSRDGLAAMYARKGSPLGDDDYEISLRYRAGYELRSSDLAAAGISDSGRGGHDNDRYAWSRLDRAKKTALVAMIDKAIALNSRDHPEALEMIRWVAGRANTLRSKGGGRAYERNLAAFLHALKIARAVARKWDEDRKREASAAKAKASA